MTSLCATTNAEGIPNRHGLLLLLTLLPVVGVWAQALPNDFDAVGRFYVQNYAPEDYGAHAQNWSMVQDERGLLYIGNTQGVLEYDGVTWRLIPIPNRSIPRALAIDADGTLISVEDDPAFISWMTPDGKILKRISGLSYTPAMTEPQGIARDPRTGHLLIVDDWEGSNSLFEFDAEGTLLGTLPLLQYGTDPEGIAIRPGSNQLFLAFDQGARIASFDYTPTLAPDAEPPPPGADCMMF